jgi:CDP-diglyceride synthetase
MANTFELIASYTATGSVSSIDFTSIPSTYTDLCLKMSLRSANIAVEALEASLTFNSNTSGYTAKQLYGTGSSAASSSPTVRPAGFIVGSSMTANTFSNIELYIPNYAGSTNKSYSVDSVAEANQTLQYMNLVAGLWSNTAAITSISIAGTSGTLATNSTAYLYGVKNA